MSRPLREVSPQDLSALKLAYDSIARARFILRLRGARKAAQAVSKAMKSVDGAIRHAERCVNAKAYST